MLILSFIIFVGSIVAMSWMVFRLFPELSQVTIVHHKHFSFLGIENVHILEYKKPAEVLRKNFFIFLEKTLRRMRSFILKMDNINSRALEFIQQKHHALQSSEAIHSHAIPTHIEPPKKETLSEPFHSENSIEVRNIKRPVRAIHREIHAYKRKGLIDIQPPKVE